MKDWIIELEGVAVRAERGPILEGASLIVARRTIHALVGPNGAGKSTLIKVLLRRVPFTGRARVAWQGSGRIGYVPQSFELDRSLPLTVDEFLAAQRTAWPVCLGMSTHARVHAHQLLETVGLDPTVFGRRLLGSLSGGELQRVLFANALDPVPELLILDEPTAALDPASVARLEQSLLAARNDHASTVLFVSHDLPLVRRIADRVTVFEAGQLQTGRPEELLS